MTAFGARPSFPTYIGGGELWTDPDPLPPKWWHRIVRFLHGCWLFVSFQWWRL